MQGLLEFVVGAAGAAGFFCLLTGVLALRELRGGDPAAAPRHAREARTALRWLATGLGLLLVVVGFAVFR